MSVLKSSLGVFATRVWGAFVGIVVSVLIARHLGPEGKGIYSLLLLIPTLLVTFGNIGLGVANVYFFGKKGAKPEELASNSLWAAIVSGLIMIALFLIAYPFLADTFFADVPHAYIISAVMLVPFMLTNSYLASLLLATKRTRQFNIANAIQLAILLASVLIMLLVLDLGIQTTILATVINITAGSIIMTWFFSRSYQLRLKFNRKLFRETITYGIKGYFANVIQFLNYRLDLLLISFFLDAAAVGWYSVAVNFAELLWYVPTSIGTVLFPHIANASAGAANIVTARLSRQTFALMFVATLAVAFLAPWAIPFFFGAEFSPAITALLYLLPGALLFSIAKIIGNDFAGRGLIVSNAVVSGIALGLNVTLNVILVPRMGILGASLSSTISYTVHTVLMIGLFARVAKLAWYRLLWPTKNDLKDLFEALKRDR